MKGELEPLLQPAEDYNSAIFRQIFSDTDKPFSDRLDEAVKFANRSIKRRIETQEEIRKIFELYGKTGFIPLKTTYYELTN